MTTLTEINTENAICTLSLQRPQAYNALSDELMLELIERLRTVANDKTVKVIIIKGAGKGFCAGHDLSQLMQDQDQKRQHRTFEICSEMMQLVQQIPQPVIAQVHGVATAAGCQLVASCDLAISSDDARFATPGVNIGLFCSTPMVALSRTIAPKHALEMLMLGEMIDASRAVEMGLINKAVAVEQLEAEVQRWAQLLAAKSGPCLATGKQAFYQQLKQPLEQAYRDCSKVMSCNLQHPDACEGIDAFLNKRHPQWPSE